MSTKEEAYILGDSSNEAARLEAWNDVLTANALGGKPLSAPLDLSKPNLTVLDAGCANGAWLRTLSPHLTEPYSLVGIDTWEAFFPQTPPKYTKFINHNFTKPWPANFHNHFDVVHCRASLGACGPFPIKDAVKGLVGCAKSGGWVQLVDLDMREYEEDGPTMKHMLSVAGRFFDQIQVGRYFSLQLKEYLEEAGCVDVGQEIVSIKEGSKCPDESMGKKAIEATIGSVEAMIRGAKQAQVSVDEKTLDAIAPALRDEFEKQGGLWRVVVVTGRKA